MSKIKKIYVKNIKSVVEQELDLNGASAIVTAGNNKGKTTVLSALTDRIKSQKPEIVLRQGETEGVSFIELTTGERFTWEIKSDKEKLTFHTKDGIKMNLKRDISKKFFSESFDIDKFLNEGPKKQTEMLQKTLGIDLSDVNSRYEEAYNNRTYLNRHRDELKPLAQTEVDTTLPDQETDIQSLNDEYKNALKRNSEIDNLYSKHDEKIHVVERLKKEIEDLKKQLKNEESELKDLTNNLKNVRKIDTQDIERKINEAQEKNREIAKNNKAKEDQALYKKAEAAAKKADDEVKAIEQERVNILSQTKLPNGIELTSDGITVDGLPLDRKQLSLSKIYITALKLASLNLSEVKTLYFDAAPLDKNSLSEIQKWAQSQDYQLLIEKPDFDGGDIEYQIIKE